MKFWKPCEWWWDDREWKFHSDFQLDVGETLEIKVNGKLLLKRQVPKGEIWKVHLAGSFQPFKKKK